jgi:hypothetical protein
VGAERSAAGTNGVGHRPLCEQLINEGLPGRSDRSLASKPAASLGSDALGVRGDRGRRLRACITG